MSEQEHKPFRIPKSEHSNQLYCYRCDSVVAETDYGDGTYSKYYECKTCDRLLREDLVIRHDKGLKPLGKVGGKFGNPMFKPVNRRGSRRFKGYDNDVFNIDDYKLAGKTDLDLQFLSNQGIVTSIEDSFNDVEDQ